jgi:hypothetical protein
MDKDKAYNTSEKGLAREARRAAKRKAQRDELLLARSRAKYLDNFGVYCGKELGTREAAKGRKKDRPAGSTRPEMSADDKEKSADDKEKEFRERWGIKGNSDGGVEGGLHTD